MRDSDNELDPEIENAILAVQRWDRVVDTFEYFIAVSLLSNERSTRYRLNLLWVHAVSALFMAPLLWATGRAGITGPSFGFLRTIPGAPYSLAVLLAVSGTVLGTGCVFRAKLVEIYGLAGLGSFYATLAISFAIPPIQWFASAGHGIKPPLYGAVVYTHLTLIMLLHLVGLIIKRRDDASRRIGPGGVTG